MTIARVVHISGLTGEPSEEVIKAIDAIRTSDGCEGMYAFRKGQASDGMSVSLWRDQEALDQAMGTIKAANEAAIERGLTIASAEVYDVVAQR